MKKNWPAVIAIILLFFAGVLFAMGVLTCGENKGVQADSRVEFIIFLDPAPRLC